VGLLRPLQDRDREVGQVHLVPAVAVTGLGVEGLHRCLSSLPISTPHARAPRSLWARSSRLVCRFFGPFPDRLCASLREAQVFLSLRLAACRLGANVRHGTRTARATARGPRPEMCPIARGLVPGRTRTHEANVPGRPETRPPRLRSQLRSCTIAAAQLWKAWTTVQSAKTF